MTTFDDAQYPAQGTFPNPTDTFNGTNTEPATYPGGPLPESVETAYPGKFLVVEPHRPRLISESPVLRNISVGTTPQIALGPNRKRARVLVYTDASNTVPVFVSASQVGANGLGNDNSIGLFPNSQPFEMRHTGAVYVFASTFATVYVYEESYE